MLIQNKNIKIFPSLPNSGILPHLDKPLAGTFYIMQTQLELSEQEIWKDVVDYEGQYEVSNTGKLRYVPKTIMRFRKDTGKSHAIHIKGKTSFGSLNKKGYFDVKLWKDGTSKSIVIHRLIAQSYIPNPSKLPQVNHIDGVKTNNRVENLEWCDNAHNVKHAYVLGLAVGLKGEKQNGSKIKESDVLEIRKFYADNPTAFYRIYAEKLNLSIKSICSIVNRKSWTHI